MLLRRPEGLVVWTPMLLPSTRVMSWAMEMNSSQLSVEEFQRLQERTGLLIHTAEHSRAWASFSRTITFVTTDDRHGALDEATGGIQWLTGAIHFPWCPRPR